MNIFRDSYIPFVQFGGTSMSSEFTNFNNEEGWIALYIGEAGFAKQTSLPDGNYPPVTWRIPLTAGAISSRNKVIGVGSMSPTGNLGYEILATLSGSGDISSAAATLIVNLIASISGDGGVSSAAIEAFLLATANLTGQGALTSADLRGIGELIGIITGNSSLNATLTGIGELTSSIKSYGDLTPEAVRDSVWAAVASNYNVSGTMGAKLNSAASGGVDYDALANAVWDKEVSGNTGTQAGKILEDIKKKSNMIPGLF